MRSVAVSRCRGGRGALPAGRPAMPAAACGEREGPEAGFDTRDPSFDFFTSAMETLDTVGQEGPPPESVLGREGL
jgi:hypothetical protein